MGYSYEKKYDAVIVGAGAIGCSIAFFLARESQGKFKVALVDRNVVGDESSSGAAGMLAAQIETEAAGPFFDLQVQSREIFKWLSGELEDITGVNIRYSKKGILELARNPEDRKTLETRMAWQKAAGLSVEWLDGGRITQDYPFLKNNPDGGLLAPEDGQVSSSHLVQALCDAAKKLGVDVFESESFDDPVLKAPRQGFLETNISRFTAGHFIFATGAWTGRLLGGGVPIDPVKGQILIYETPEGWGKAKGWETPIYCGKVPCNVPAVCYLVPKSDNEVWVGSTGEKRGLDKSENTEATLALAKAAAEVLPEISTFKLKSVWMGLRPGTPDGLPLLGLLPGFDNVHVASGHFRNGILLSAVTGKIFADILLKGKSSLNLDAFSPSRFVKTASAA
ncbi:MAG: glycine oxidase ThiO [Elusimicrobia bacterium RIFCSPLOWO2_01_FULL_54_10]|nr:MAG: glycine oxidase ThiO [Elusimicrobia bacterium RIFCSPLOWO2_01_FULL_54_10]